MSDPDVLNSFDVSAYLNSLDNQGVDALFDEALPPISIEGNLWFADDGLADVCGVIEEVKP